ncbi:MAG: hypothetical protein KDD62_06855 [Bdellovibrionales bacterium]|nr:hypothetical protein [Bdellovibrionales bacterium]
MSNEQSTIITIAVGAVSAVVGGFFQYLRAARKDKSETEVVTFQTLLKGMQGEIDRLNKELETERAEKRELQEHVGALEDQNRELRSQVNDLESRIIALEKK